MLFFLLLLGFCFVKIIYWIKWWKIYSVICIWVNVGDVVKNVLEKIWFYKLLKDRWVKMFIGDSFSN